MVSIEISRKVFNNVYLPYLQTQNRYEIYWGSAGSGKSFFIAQKYINKLLTQKMCNLLVVRQTGDTNRDSTFALFKQVVNKWNMAQLFHIKESDLRIKCKNGNEIIFKGLDDSEKLKSITFSRGELTDVWIEEASEIEESDFKQLDVRLRGGNVKKQIIISFNPVDINHWLKKFVDKKQDNKMTLHTTYKDNKFLDDEYKILLESYKDTDPYYYDVYCCGNWGVLGQSIFDKNIINRRLSVIRDVKPLRRGLFEYQYVNEKIVDSSIKWVDDDSGYVNIYHDKIQGYPYVIGGDTAGDGSDNFVGQVIDNTTGRQVATLKHQFDEDLYASQMYCLGRYYNDALIGVESNYSTHPIKELKRLGYPKQYLREKEDNLTEGILLKYGFRTDTLTRPIIIANLVSIARDHIVLFNDVTTLEEMLTFSRNPKKRGRPEAANGAHDDCLMAMAITYYIRDQQRHTPIEEPEEIKEKLIDKLIPKNKRIR